MKPYLSALFLTLSFATFALADNYATTARDANFRTSNAAGPEVRAAIDQLNIDVKAWNARCAVTNSDAEQSWCEEQRAALDARKRSLRDGAVPKSSLNVYPTVDVYLRYATRGKLLKHVQTDSTGHFDLGTFPASNYIMEFRAKRKPGMESQRFAIRIDGIKAKGRQGGIEAKYLLGGFGLDVDTTPGTPIKGQVTSGSLEPTKKMVWMPQELGTNLPAHWVEEGSGKTVARNGAGYVRRDTLVKIQDHVDFHP